MYSFWIILTGSLVAASCGLLGTYLVIRKMSLLGDAISHAVLPGIVIAFLLSGSRAVIPMFIGAAVFGLLTTFLVEVFHRKWAVQEDASIGIVFTALFALGVVLISVFAGSVDLDQECVLYGEIAYTPWDTLLIAGTDMGPRPVWILGFVFLLNICFIALFYKELKVVSFDPAMAVSVGISSTVLHYLLMGAVSITTVASFESVGAILVVAMLIVPGASALLWSARLSTILVLSVLFGILSSVLGYWLAYVLNSSIAGAITVVMGALFTVSFFFAPHQGILSKALHQWRLGFRMATDHILLHGIRTMEKNPASDFSRDSLIEASSTARFIAGFAIRRLLRERFLEQEDGQFVLTSAGKNAALELLQKHRLWESYLSEIGMPEDHLHEPADELEHYIDDTLKEKLLDQVKPETDKPQE